MSEAEKPGKELESWKEIAAYLGTSVRTVQRWEEQNGLPVRRVMREKRAAIYADTAELDRWVASRTVNGGKTEAATEEEGSRPQEKTTVPGKPGSRWVGAAVMVAVLVGGVAWVGRRPEAGPELQARRVTSEPGFETQPAVSPDGEWIAYVRTFRGRSTVAVRPAEREQAVQLGEGDGQIYSPQWSRDGRWIAYLRRISDERSELFLYDWRSRSGPVRVAEVMGRNWFDAIVHAYPALQWTPDGKGLLVVERGAPEEPWRIVRLDLGTQGRTVVMEGPAGVAIHGFALSPEARRLAVVLRRDKYFRVHVGGVDEELRLTGELRAVMEDESSTESPGWLPGGDLLFIRDQKELWRMEEGKSPQRVRMTGQWPDYAVSGAVGDRVYWSHVVMDTAILLYDPRKKEALQRLCDSTTMERRPRVSPDGKELLFNSERDGTINAWVCDLETESARQISKARGGAVWASEWSPDGKRIAYLVEEPGRGELHVTDGNRTMTAIVAAGPGKWSSPMWSGDGSRVHYLWKGEDRMEIRSVGVGGGEARVERAVGEVQEAALRRDGRYWLLRNGRLLLTEAAGGEERVMAENVTELSALLPDRLGISYARRINSNLMGNYVLWEMEGDGREREVAGPVREGMGFHPGPAGFALAVVNSDAGADVFMGGPLQ